VIERSAENILSTNRWMKVALWSTAVALLIFVGLGIYFSREPDIFWVNRSADAETATIGIPTTDTLIRVAETLLDKQGGYLTNDKMPPGVFLDNIPSWEYGVVTQVRDLGRVMRDDYSRSQSQSKEDPDMPGAHRSFSSTTTPGSFRRQNQNIVMVLTRSLTTDSA